MEREREGGRMRMEFLGFSTYIRSCHLWTGIISFLPFQFGSFYFSCLIAQANASSTVLNRIPLKKWDKYRQKNQEAEEKVLICLVSVIGYLGCLLFSWPPRFILRSQSQSCPGNLSGAPEPPGELSLCLLSHYACTLSQHLSHNVIVLFAFPPVSKLLEDKTFYKYTSQNSTWWVTKTIIPDISSLIFLLYFCNWHTCLINFVSISW
jgi:hypothetical protein